MESFDNLFERDIYFGPRFLSGDPHNGRIVDRSGHALFAFDAEMIRGIVQTLEQTYGGRTNAIFRLCGRMLGEQWSDDLERDIKEYYGAEALEFPVAFVHALLNEALAAFGWGSLQIDFTHREQGVFVIEVREPPFSEIAPDSSCQADELIGGFLSGFFSHFSGTELDCFMTESPDQGQNTCRFVIASSSRIEKLKPHDAGLFLHADVLSQLHAMA